MEQAERETHERPQTAASDGAATLKHVFIVGFPRSGTTWVMWLMARLPGVAVLQQSGLFHALEDLRTWWGRPHRFSGGSSEESRTVDELLDAESYARLVRPLTEHVFHSIAGACPGTRVVVEQTPENLQFQEEVLELYPDAYFLHVVRDPRDAACSMRRAARAWENEFPGRPIHIANRWVEYAERARKLAARTERIRTVRYEDLLERGDAELAGIAEWLGIEASGEVLRRAVEACSFGTVQRRESGHVPKGFFGGGTSGSWRSQLSRRDLRILEYVLGDELEAAGYKREHPRSRSKPLAVSLHEVLALRAQRPQRRIARWFEPLRKWFLFRRRERDYTRAKARN